MNIILLILGILLLIGIFYLFLISPGKSTDKMRAPFSHCNVAHRGLHSKDKTIPENSLAAFSAAIQAGYGIELDIQLSKDQQLVVFHDDTLDRVCKIHGRVDEYTYEELSKFSLCNTKEHIPLFSDVLALINGKVPIVVELKNGHHNKILCKKVLELLRSYSGSFCIESFHPLIVGWFRKNAKDVLRGQLSAPANEFNKLLSPLYCFGLSRVLSNFYARPHFIAYKKTKRPFSIRLCELLGAMRFIWTIHPEDIEHIEKEKYNTIIFEYYSPKN